MKVKFIKDHLEHKANDVATLPDGLGNYLVRVKAAEEYKESGKDPVKPVVKKVPAKKKAAKGK